MNPASHPSNFKATQMSSHPLYTEFQQSVLRGFNPDLYQRRVLADGSVEYREPGAFYRRPKRTRHANQQRKAHWRKASGKSSYRQRQASARAAKAKRAEQHPVSA